VDPISLILAVLALAIVIAFLLGRATMNQAIVGVLVLILVYLVLRYLGRG
jgi:hypothetical protein